LIVNKRASRRKSACAPSFIAPLHAAARATMMRRLGPARLGEDPMERRTPRAIMFACAAAVAGWSLGGPAAAAEQGSPMTIIPKFGKLDEKTASPEALFSALDSDGSGGIDRAEWQTRKMAIFYMRDRNNDIQLSPEEIPGLAPERFAAADLNKDGVLSGYEFNQAALSQFDAADRNSDGVVSVAEFRAYTETLSTPR
jgi:hypothetical protein